MDLNSPSERLLYYLEYTNSVKTHVAKSIGLTLANLWRYIGKGKKSTLGAEKVELLRKATNINIAWYLTGEGEMLQDNTTIQMPEVTIDPNSQIEIITITDTVLVPTIESAFPCGVPEHNEGNIVKLAIKKEFIIGVKDPYMLNCKGTSMSPLIEEGDYIIVETLHGDYSKLSNSDVVIAFINDQFTVKRYFKKNGHYLLVPENLNNHEPILVDKTEEFRILGIVRKVIRNS